MLTPGVFQAQVERHWWEANNRDGTAILAVEVSVFDGESDQKQTGRIYFTPKAAGMARGQLRAFDFDPNTQNIVDIGASIDFTGRTVEVVLEEHTYNNRTEIRIARFGGRPKPPTPDAMSAAQKALHEVKKTPPKKPTKAVATQPAEGSLDGDIPF